MTWNKEYKQCKSSVQMMEIPAAEPTLDKTIQTCRKVELTTTHIKTLSQSENLAVSTACS